MTIIFNIAVIDEQPNSVRAVIERVKRTIKLDGLTPDHITMSDQTALDSFIRRNDIADKVNLIIVDKNLGLAEDGASVIRRLRARAPHLPVIFYSADNAQGLRQKIAELQIDGVFCCNRQDLFEECLNIYRSLSKLYIQPHSIRGFLVSEASIIDDNLRLAVESLKDYFGEKGLATIRNKVISELSQHKDSIDEFINRISASENLNDILDGQKVSTFYLLKILIDLLKASPENRLTTHYVEILEQLVEEVIHPRNILAHGIQSKCGNYISLGERRFELNQNSARQQRANLERQKDNLIQLIEHLKRGT